METAEAEEIMGLKMWHPKIPKSAEKMLAIILVLPCYPHFQITHELRMASDLLELPLRICRLPNKEAQVERC